MSRNLLIADAKFTTLQTIKLLHCFCSGVPVSPTSEYAEISRRTVREVFFLFRSLLDMEQFNKWHGLHTIDIAAFRKQRILDNLSVNGAAECYFNRYCHRNFVLGNRHQRVCRACPLWANYTIGQEGQEVCEGFIRFLDNARAFYSSLGIREAPGYEPSITFRLQVIHYAIISNVLANSGFEHDGLIDMKQRTPGSGGRLMAELERAVAHTPLDRF